MDLSGLAGLKALLRIRPFRRLWLVLGVSSLGDWLGLLASAIFASAQVTGSGAKGAAFGGVIAVRMLPALILGPVAGVVADRWDRRYTMVVCDLTRFVMFASIPGITLLTADPKIILGWTGIATFVIETQQMAWGPAKDAAVPNLLPRARLESANQLTLATTYGVTPVLAGLTLAALTTIVNTLHKTTGRSPFDPTHVGLYFDALTFLATALTVFFGIKEISGRAGPRPSKKPPLWREFVSGWAYVGRTPLVRGLVLGILGAFAGAGVVVGTAQFYARSLGGGDATFYILFAILFVGLGVGIVAGPRVVGALSRRRWFGLSIVLAAASVTLLSVAWHLVIAVCFAFGVGVGAGMAFLAGTTLLGTEVGDEVRGRVFAFIQTGTQVTLLLTISVSSVVVGYGSSREVLGVPISTTRILLFCAGLFGVIAGLGALRQMDDKRGVPLLADVFGSVRGRPLSLGDQVSRVGIFVVIEGGDGAGKTTHARRLAERLRAEGREVLLTREPGATDVGGQIRTLLLSGGPLGLSAVAPRTEALLYAADRAHHVATVIRPALERGAVVISERYVDSALAYQEAGRTLPVDEVAWLSGWATGGLRPDLVVLLDLDPAEGLRRATGRPPELAEPDAQTLHFAERVRYAFLDLSATDPKRYLVLDASRPEDAVAGLIADRVHGLLPAPGPAEVPVVPPAPLVAGPATSAAAPVVDPTAVVPPDGDGTGPAERSRAESRS
ncbi:MAG: dTMP kinase [Actinobacteria bacterium 13_1_20CM_3_71_11]|nr:MAG: dTMP kinase [Actinobacteria bacterium 13_1_20CM_3_71_11]